MNPGLTWVICSHAQAVSLLYHDSLPVNTVLSIRVRFFWGFVFLSKAYDDKKSTNITIIYCMGFLHIYVHDILFQSPGQLMRSCSSLHSSGKAFHRILELSCGDLFSHKTIFHVCQALILAHRTWPIYHKNVRWKCCQHKSVKVKKLGVNKLCVQRFIKTPLIYVFKSVFNEQKKSLNILHTDFSFSCLDGEQCCKGVWLTLWVRCRCFAI